MSGPVTTSRAHYYQYNPSLDIWESQVIEIPLSAQDVKIVQAAKKYLRSRGFGGEEPLQLFHYERPSERSGLVIFCDNWGDKYKLVTADGETFAFKKGRFPCCVIL